MSYPEYCYLYEQNSDSDYKIAVILQFLRHKATENKFGNAKNRKEACKRDAESVSEIKLP